MLKVSQNYRWAERHRPFSVCSEEGRREPRLEIWMPTGQEMKIHIQCYFLCEIHGSEIYKAVCSHLEVTLTGPLWINMNATVLNDCNGFFKKFLFSILQLCIYRDSLSPSFSSVCFLSSPLSPVFYDRLLIGL